MCINENYYDFYRIDWDNKNLELYCSLYDPKLPFEGNYFINAHRFLVDNFIYTNIMNKIKSKDETILGINCFDELLL
jgi:hypothetical protein